MCRSDRIAHTPFPLSRRERGFLFLDRVPRVGSLTLANPGLNSSLRGGEEEKSE